MSWWNNYKEDFFEAYAYYLALLEKKDDLEEFFREYKKETLYRLVFESNTIENEGLKANETRKLSLGIDNELNSKLREAFEKLGDGEAIKLNELDSSTSLISLFNIGTENLHKISSDEKKEEFVNVIFGEIQKYLFKEMHKLFKHEELKFIEDSISGKAIINYKESIKEFQITFNQIFALTVNNTFTELIEYIIKSIKPIIKNLDTSLISNIIKNQFEEDFLNFDFSQIESFINLLKSLSGKNIRGVAGSFLSSGDYLKTLHEIVGNKLDNNDNGKPGEYRVEAAFVDLDTTFLQASLIEQAMNNLAQKSFERSIDKRYNFFLEACQNSALFIKIHPFGDFNGRISRIMLNNFFIINKLPFYIVLRSGSKDKKKYIESMKRYYESRKIDKYLSLISKTFIKQINEINESLDIAGLDIIKPKELGEEDIKKLEESLKFYNI